MLRQTDLPGRPAALLGLLAFALHLAVNGTYPVFRDELYYIVCGWHLAWGYMDQPPLTPALAAAAHALFGTWMTGFRLVPAMCFAATVVLTVNLARLLGGGRFAPWLAGTALFAAAVLQLDGMLLTTDVAQAPLWTACTYALVRAVRDRRPAWWLVLGACGGVAFLGKYSVAFHLGSLGAALLATAAGRRALAAPRAWAGAALMLAIAAPNLAWQWAHGFPFAAHMRDLAANHTEHLSPVGFMAQQVLQMNPATLPVWGAGLAALLFWPRLRAVRWIGVGYLLLMGFGIATHGKPYYVSPAYPGLLAAGGVALEAWVAAASLRATLMGAVIAGGGVFAPAFLPVLPPARLAAYLRWLGLVPGTGEKLELGALPQYFADTFGWQEMADAVGSAWRKLPPDDRARAVFIGRNYGEAAALDVLGHGPDAVSLHQSYWYWGPKGHDGSVVLRYGGSRARLLTYFASVEQVGHTGPGWGMPYETDQPVWLCRFLRVPLATYWPGHMTDN